MINVQFNYSNTHPHFFVQYPHRIHKAISFWKVEFQFSKINVKEIIQMY